MPVQKIRIFQVAFSFAGEQRELVRSIAEAVAQEIGREHVFFDSWHEAYVAGMDGDSTLQAIYSECVLAVACLSKEYDAKAFPHDEWRAIKARLHKERDDVTRLGVLPIRVGDGDIDGIFPQDIVKDVRLGVENAAHLILQRLEAIRASQRRSVPGGALFALPPRPTVVGRDQLIELLRTRLIEHGVLAVRGMPGVGKSAVALALAHEPAIRRLYSDGVLWTRLGQSAELSSVLTGWATALGLAHFNELKDLASQIASVRDALQSRRLLLAIDDAWPAGPDHASVAEDLRLGGPGCGHLVTTRSRELALNFVDFQGAVDLNENVVTVPELDEDDGVRLFAKIAPLVAGSEPDRTRALVFKSGALPQAIILHAHFLKIKQSEGSVETAFARLEEARARLLVRRRVSALDEPGMPASLSEAIGISYENLQERPRAALRDLGVFPPKPNSFSGEAAKYVAGADDDTLTALVEAGLAELDDPATKRYTLHQTIADFAATHLATDAPAHTRFSEYFVGYIERHERDSAAIDEEFAVHANIAAALQSARATSSHRLLIRGVNGLCRHLFARGLYTRAEAYLEWASAAGAMVSSPGDPSSDESVSQLQARTLKHKGTLEFHRQNYAKSQEYANQALALIRPVDRGRNGDGDRMRADIAELLTTLANGAQTSGDPAQAETYLKDASGAAKESRDDAATMQIEYKLGELAAARGATHEAAAHFVAGLDLARRGGSAAMEASALLALMELRSQEGSAAAAEEYHQQLDALLARYRSGGERRDRWGESLQIVLAIAGAVSKRSGAAALGLLRGALLDVVSLASRLSARPAPNLVAASDDLQMVRIDLLRAVSELEKSNGNYESAQQSEIEAHDIAQELENVAHVAEQLFRMGLLEVAQKHYESADGLLRRALEQARILGHVGLATNVQLALGDVALGRSDSGSAARMFAQALSTGRESGNRPAAARALMGLAESAAAEADMDRARAHAYEAIATWDMIRDSSSSEQLRQWLAEVVDVSASDPSEPLDGLLLPDPWRVTEDREDRRPSLLSPDRRANILFKVESLAPGIGSQEYATQVALLFPGRFDEYRVLAFAPLEIAGGRTAYLRRFEHRADIGPVTQIQLTYADGGKGFLLTGTTRSADFAQQEARIRRALKPVVRYLLAPAGSQGESITLASP